MHLLYSEHYEIVKKEHPRFTKHEIERIHVEQFASWFAKRVSNEKLANLLIYVQNTDPIYEKLANLR